MSRVILYYYIGHYENDVFFFLICLFDYSDFWRFVLLILRTNNGVSLVREVKKKKIRKKEVNLNVLRNYRCMFGIHVNLFERL